MEISCPAFKEGQEIPARYTCQGENMSPALFFHNVPKNTQSFVLIVEDPDAPRGNFVHWLAWNIPADVDGWPEATPTPRQGMNDFGSQTYRGPCPPKGKKHRYFFRLYALDSQLEVEGGSSKVALLEGMRGHVLDHAELMGTFEIFD